MAATKNKAKARQLCEHIENTLNVFKIHGMNYNEYSDEDMIMISFLQKFFGIRINFELFVLCHLIVSKLSGNEGLSTKKLIRLMHLKLIESVDLEYSIHNLTKKKYIQSSGNNYHETEYKLTESCLKAILSFDRKGLKLSSKKDFADFMKEFDDILQDNTDFLIDFVPDLIEDLFRTYFNCKEVKWIEKNIKLRINQSLLCIAVREHLLFGEAMDYEQAVKTLTNRKFEQKAFEKELQNGTNQLVKDGYLTFEKDFFIGRMLRLTEKSIGILCSEISIEKRSFMPQMFSLSNPEQLKSDNYMHTNRDLQFIEKILSNEVYTKIQSRVPRISILLTGAPGVGKTSFINHVAIKTGRPVLSANIATILSSYVGESEKNIVKLFAEASEAYKKFDVIPIIVFDEAEALLYNRSSKANKAVDQMHNNVISLLLSELDKFKGILICCSNFSFKQESFDPALHRRFYMVSEIKAPPTDVLKSILKYHFPEISAVDADKFMCDFPFITPAQIRNLKDKFEIQSLIDEGFATGYDAINSIARKDLDVFIRRKGIGFTDKNYN